MHAIDMAAKQATVHSNSTDTGTQVHLRTRAPVLIDSVTSAGWMEVATSADASRTVTVISFW